MCVKERERERKRDRERKKDRVCVLACVGVCNFVATKLSQLNDYSADF